MSSTATLVLFGILIAAGGWYAHALWMRRKGLGTRTQPAAETKGNKGVRPREGMRPPFGSCNRTTFCLALGHRLAESRLAAESLSLIIVRVDDDRRPHYRRDFQTVASTARAVGELFMTVLRATDWVVLLDATTLAVVLPSARLVDAISIGERLRGAVSRCCFSGDVEGLQVALSTGIAVAIEEDDCQTLLGRAEAAMQAAVQAGGNGSCYHTGRRSESVAYPAGCGLEVPC